MCKHILNAQVSIRAPCCRRFFDCPRCHTEQSDDNHKLGRTTEMQFVCKQCKRAFRKDLSQFEEEDEFCPHCDNHYVVVAETADSAAASAEGEDGAGTRRETDYETLALLDDRQRFDPRQNWLARDMVAGEEGERIDEGGLVGVLQHRQESDRRAAQAAKNMQAVMSAAQLHQSGAQAFNDEDLDWS